jgi:hypothetical protein
VLPDVSVVCVELVVLAGTAPVAGDPVRLPKNGVILTPVDGVGGVGVELVPVVVTGVGLPVFERYAPVIVTLVKLGAFAGTAAVAGGLVAAVG